MDEADTIPKTFLRDHEPSLNDELEIKSADDITLKCKYKAVLLAVRRLLYHQGILGEWSMFEDDYLSHVVEQVAAELSTATANAVKYGTAPKVKQFFEGVIKVG